MRIRRAVRQTRAVLADVEADVVIGFGGYVALPAYLAARGGWTGRRRVPVVIHEANASCGLGQQGRRPICTTGAVRGAESGPA